MVVAVYLEKVYRHLLRVIGINEIFLVWCSANEATDPSCADGGEKVIRTAYNIILTSNYIMLIPRSVPNAGLNINAMGEFLAPPW